MEDEVAEFMFIDYLPLMKPSPMEVMMQGWSDEKRFQQELAKQNYLDIHKRRGKR